MTVNASQRQRRMTVSPWASKTPLGNLCLTGRVAQLFLRRPDHLQASAPETAAVPAAESAWAERGRATDQPGRVGRGAAGNRGPARAAADVGFDGTGETQG
jgi:hypothetical protein